VLSPREGDARAAWLALFRKEAQTLAALSHPAIVRVFDVGVASHHGVEHPWMAFEWLDGVTLDESLRGADGRSPREALALLQPAFDALAFAHDAGVCHRDIKPSNVMVVKAARGAPGLRVIDFGIAKADDDRDPGSGHTATDSSLVAFSAAYAAPEQVTRTRTGPWTDVHALGLLVTEVLTGERPYGDVQGAGVVEAILRSERPTPGRAGVDVGPWEAVLARAMARYPADRPQRAAALWTELSSCVEEAQAAWAAHPRPPRRSPPIAPAAETLAPATVATASSAPAVVTPPAAPTSSVVPVAVTARRPSAWVVVVAALATAAVALVFAATTQRASTASARPAAWVEPTPVVVAPAPVVDPRVPAVEAPAPAAVAVRETSPPPEVRAVEAPRVATKVAPRRLPRRVVAPDAGVRVVAPSAPRLVVE
jgi:serine/threonine-protein kinase